VAILARPPSRHRRCAEILDRRCRFASLQAPAGRTLPWPSATAFRPAWPLLSGLCWVRGGGPPCQHLRPSQASWRDDSPAYGNTALLIQFGGGSRVCCSSFKAVGCAPAWPSTRVSADVILASSRMLDEGGRGLRALLVNPGSYGYGRASAEGGVIPTGPSRQAPFGMATIWRWKQGGLEFHPIGRHRRRRGRRPRCCWVALMCSCRCGRLAPRCYTGAEAAEVVREAAPPG